MEMNGDVVSEVERFEYLGSILRKKGCLEEDMNYWICVDGRNIAKRHVCFMQ